ncbi:Malate dehydrogenase [Frankliniella fusca]|uniref:Malate dehydrogenase n=1 Tax=Frankliniella fusca TaxID=407009 RepID=A0AAE1HTJ9_9NEOP|nr:Malate dehydrogenase [Frankliniella fusca]
MSVSAIRGGARARRFAARGLQVRAPVASAAPARHASCSPATEGSVVALAEARRFISDAMKAVGTAKDNADFLAEVLVEADYRGHYSHGLNRLELYVDDVAAGSCLPAAEPRLLRDGPSTAWVDGGHGLGPVVGRYCMQLAIDKARQTGVGWVVAKGSNHYGIAGWYSMQALKKKMMGMSFTNTSPLVSPTRSKGAALGTNPISLAVPAGSDSYVLDMATTAAALGKIEMQRRRGEPLPPGWAQGPDGAVTTDAELAYKTQCLMPLGGAEDSSGYKGYGLALMVETFCGLLAGSAYGPDIRRWGSSGQNADLGQCFIAVDPAAFAPGFEDRAADLLSRLRTMEPADHSSPVLVPGDPERRHMAHVDKQGGVRYVPQQIESSENLANRLKISPMKTLA